MFKIKSSKILAKIWQNFKIRVGNTGKGVKKGQNLGRENFQGKLE